MAGKFFLGCPDLFSRRRSAVLFCSVLLCAFQLEMKRTVSLGNLHDTMEQQEALQEFYTFMDQASTSGDSGVKDAHLSVYSHALGGVLHFFHFETRFMDHAVEVLGNSPIHRNIQVRT